MSATTFSLFLQLWYLVRPDNRVKLEEALKEYLEQNYAFGANSESGLQPDCSGKNGGKGAKNGAKKGAKKGAKSAEAEAGLQPDCSAPFHHRILFPGHAFLKRHQIEYDIVVTHPNDILFLDIGKFNSGLSYN